jgi:exonuclease SbcC
LQRAVAALAVKQRGEADSEAVLGRELAAAKSALSAAAARTLAAGAEAEGADAAWVAFRSKHGSADLLAQAARDAAGLSKIRRSIADVESQIARSREALGRAVGEAELLLTQGAAAEERVGAARRELERIRLVHAAAGVRRLLEPGEPCPVCLHPVGELPELGRGHASLESAEGDLRAAEAARDSVRSASAANRLDLETLPRRAEADRERLAQLLASLRAIEEVAERLVGERVEDPGALLKKLEVRAKSTEAEAASAGRARQSAREAEAGLLDSFQKIETRLALLRQARENTARELEEKRGEISAAAMPDALEKLEGEEKALRKARDLNERLAREQAEAERAASKAEVDERSISERLALTVATLASLSERATDLRGQLEGLPVDERIDARLAEARERMQRIDSALGAARLARKTVADHAREAAELGRRVAVLGKEGAIYSRLGTLLRTDQFVAWILKDAFARLAYEGSRQLETLSNGRYTFAAGGDDFAVCDRWNAGERRSVNTLSGGESFLASLSLALALSRGLPEFAANRDRLHLDSLFLDEGFSTLDAETLDTVLGAVEMLQSDCRLIGVISHAPELAERLPGRIEVVKGANGSRVVVR